jgi:hypothetical protein
MRNDRSMPDKRKGLAIANPFPFASTKRTASFPAVR